MERHTANVASADYAAGFFFLRGPTAPDAVSCWSQHPWESDFCTQRLRIISPDERASPAGPLQLVKRSLEEQPSLMNDPEVYGDLLNFTEEMAGAKNCNARFNHQPPEQFAHIPDAGGVEPICRLVED